MDNLILWISVQNGRSYSSERITENSWGITQWMVIFAAVGFEVFVGRSAGVQIHVFNEKDY